VLSADVRLEGFTSTDWIRVLSLFRPRRASGELRDPNRPYGGVVAVHARGKLIKLVHTEVGRLRLDDTQRDFPIPAEELARRHHAGWAATLEVGTLERIMDTFGARARRGDDISIQMINLFHIMREELIEGTIDAWPMRLRGMPIPSAGMVRGTIDSVCPVGRTLLVGLFEEGELWTSIALRRGHGGFNLILGPDEVRGDMGLLAGDWRRDFRHLSRAIEERAGPLALGCFAEVATVRKLEVDPSPGAWARAAAVRDIILAPVPAALAIPLGVDVGRAALHALRAVAERIDPIGIVAPAIKILRDRTAGSGGVASVLDFHPLELLRRLLSREN
jgi:hypothetical protein